jgi:hypothetical protein
MHIGLGIRIDMKVSIRDRDTIIQSFSNVCFAVG